MKVLLFSASLKQSSLNHRLVARSAAHLSEMGWQVDLARFAEFDSPSYNEDVQNASGFPAPVEALRQRILAADGVVVASPEYNFSMPGALKNAIDWLSRYRPSPFVDKPFLLMSASPGLVGGNRGLWALRVPLESLGAHVFPSMFSLASANSAITPDGPLADEAMEKRLFLTLKGFADFAQKLGGIR